MIINILWHRDRDSGGDTTSTGGKPTVTTEASRWLDRGPIRIDRDHIQFSTCNVALRAEEALVFDHI